MCAAGSGPQDHVKPIIGPHGPARMADLGLYMWSKVGHSENTLELWCLQSFLSLLKMPSVYKTPRAGSLDSVTWCRSLKEESYQAKTIKEEGIKEWGCEIENWWLLISWVESQRSLYLLWFLSPGFPESFQWVSPFLEASCRWAPLNCDSDFVLDSSQSLYTSQTQTEAPICFSTITNETFFFSIYIFI